MRWEEYETFYAGSAVRWEEYETFYARSAVRWEEYEGCVLREDAGFLFDMILISTSWT